MNRRLFNRPGRHLFIKTLGCFALLAVSTATASAQEENDTSSVAAADTSAFNTLERSSADANGVTQFSSPTSGSAAGGQGNTGGFGGGGAGGLGGFFSGLAQAFGGGNGSNATPRLRVRLRSAVEFTPRTDQHVQDAATKILTNLRHRKSLAGVSVSLQDGVARLEGAVPDQKSSRMSEMLIRLEPGVRSVDNQLKVINSPSDR
ncbi:BON domain protein [Stieleria bergensis]|uniref:BON domain protein n=1 Tax=Stieleria bergensis TaxID=2528025 RepID=A0A517SY41_9BACT|nr:BON domain protein [Planctomycetes bacterium SV_7m_r]